MGVASAVAAGEGEPLANGPGPPRENTMKAMATTAITTTAIVATSMGVENWKRLRVLTSRREDAVMRVTSSATSRKRRWRTGTAGSASMVV